MINFKEFTKDAAIHYHLTEALVNYAYWLSSDVESYLEILEGDITEDDMEVLSSRHRFCEHVLGLADRLNSQDIINDRNYPSASQFLKGSVMYVRGALKRTEPERLLSLSKDSDLEESVTHFAIIDELDYITNYYEPYANTEHPDYLLTNAIKKLESLLGLFSSGVFDSIQSNGPVTTQKVKALFEDIAEKIADLEIARYKFTSYAKTQTAVDMLIHIGSSIYEDTKEIQNFLYTWSYLVSAWECTFDNAMKLFGLMINENSEDIHAATKAEIDKQFTSTFRHVVSANKEYNEAFINNSESYKFDIGLLTPNHYEFEPLNESREKWKMIYKI